MEKSYKTISSIFAFILILSFFGFHKTYFGLFPEFRGTSFVVHFHVATVILWFAMLIVQPMLIRWRKTNVHKLVGKFSYFLAFLIVFGFSLILNEGQLKHKDAGLVGATMFDGLLFILFYTLGIYYRKNTAYHARFMVLSALPFLNPGLGRLIHPGISVMLELSIILMLLVIEYFNQKRYKPYVIGLASFFIMLGLIMYISQINPQIIETLWIYIWG
ncbi:MAG: hypothetical protein ABIQ11_08305 [Saprospiraceae bacterium]